MPPDDNIIQETIVLPSTLENIDRALYEWVDEEMNIFCETNKGWKKSPVVWLSAERAYQIKNDKELRDDAGVLILPAITIERSSVNKNPANKGVFQAHIPPVLDEKGGSITIARRINQDKTANFANNAAYQLKKNPLTTTFPGKNKKVVYQTITIPMPVYIEVNYALTLRCEYQQQINQMVTPFITKTGAVNHFLLKKDGHTYEALIRGDFSQLTNASSLQTDERMYQAKVNIEVLGYLIGKGENEEQPKIVVRENAVEAKMPRERVIFGDIPEHIDKRGFYRE